jgi:hypothetical protein
MVSVWMGDRHSNIRYELIYEYIYDKLKLRGFGPLANYADRATAASWRSSTNFCG